MKVLDELYEELKKKDQVTADIYKEGVFDHIDRIVRKVKGKEVDNLEVKTSNEKTKQTNNSYVIKQVIKQLVDTL